jgi:hypothetical protein
MVFRFKWRLWSRKEWDFGFIGNKNDCINPVGVALQQPMNVKRRKII